MHITRKASEYSRRTPPSRREMAGSYAEAAGDVGTVLSPVTIAVAQEPTLPRYARDVYCMGMAGMVYAQIIHVKEVPE